MTLKTGDLILCDDLEYKDWGYSVGSLNLCHEATSLISV